MIKIAFICTGNCCRSQMAEGFGKYYVHKIEENIEVYSAGSIPAGYVHPLAIKVMKEKKLDISKNRSKSIKEIPFNDLNYVVTLCDNAKEMCPIIPGTKTIHWGLPDPVSAIGDEKEKTDSFRKCRDDIERRVEELIKSI